MESNTKQRLLDELLRSRQNCLLLNISMKGRCDERCQLSIIEKLLPAFREWAKLRGAPPPLHANTLTTFICTTCLDRGVVAMGEVDSYLEGFRHVVYLVKSTQLAPMNLHILKTTSDFMESVQLDGLLKNRFSNVVLLDYYNWCQYDFKEYVKGITLPKSVAMIDGFNKVVYSERDTRKSEIADIRKEYHMVNSYVEDGQIDMSTLAKLFRVKPTERLILTNIIRDKINVMAFLFGLSGTNFWAQILQFEGKNNLTTRQAKITVENIKQDCVLHSLKELLGQDWEYFEKTMPKWEIELDRLLKPLKKAKITPERFDSFCSQKLGEEFANIIVKHFKILLNND